MNAIMEKIKKFFTNLKKYFDISDYLPQQIGAIFIFIALFLTWLNQIEWTLGVLAAIGIFDIILYLMDKKTISQWIHRLFPKAIDMMIGITILIITWSIAGPELFLPICIGFILGHLFWQS